MILHPGILALILGSAISCVLILYGTILGIKILLHWDQGSNSEAQLLLERKTYLVSTLVAMVLGFSLVSGLLFLYTIEDIHPLFIGAMCATGSLNANPVGWWILLSKGAIFFCAALWVIANSMDQHCEDAPLIRLKYGALPVLALLLVIDLVLQIRYFLGLQPTKITSCCGSLFSSASQSVAGELASLPPAATMWLFYSASLLYLLTLGLCLLRSWRWPRFFLLVQSVLLLGISLASVLSFISPYIYQMPSHHCPFDMIQGHYYFIGYPLYIGLFGGIVFGLVPGLALLLPKRASLERESKRRERGWLLLSLSGYTLFLLIVTWPVLFGNFQLFAY